MATKSLKASQRLLFSKERSDRFENGTKQQNSANAHVNINKLMVFKETNCSFQKNKREKTAHVHKTNAPPLFLKYHLFLINLLFCFPSTVQIQFSRSGFHNYGAKGDRCVLHVPYLPNVIAVKGSRQPDSIVLLGIPCSRLLIYYITD